MDNAPIRLLVAEANADHLDRVAKLLAPACEAGRYEIHRVDHLTKAWRLLAEGAFDVALVGLSTCEGHPNGLVSQFQERAPQVALVVMTTGDDQRLALELLELGAQDYWPLEGDSGEVLEVTLRKAIGRHRWQARLTTANRALRSNEETLKLAIEAGQFVTWDWDCPSDMVTLSEVLPGSEQEIRTLPADELRRLVHPDDKRLVEQAIERAVATGESYQAEYRVVLPDGHLRWVADHGLPLEDSTRLVGITRDITARKESELQRTNAHKFQNAVLNALTRQLVVLDESGTIVMVNSAWNQFIEEHAPALAGRGVGERYVDICPCLANCQNHGHAAIDGISQILDGTRQSFEMEYTHHEHDQVRWFLLRASRFEWDGKCHVAISHEDITQRHAAEEALRKSEARFQRAVAGSSDGIWDWDLNSGNFWMSPRTWQMISGREEEPPSHVDSYWDLVHPEDRDQVEREVFEHVEGIKPNYHVEFRMGRTPDESRWYRARGTVSRDSQGAPTHMSGTLEDITEEVAVQVKLRRLAVIVCSSADAILSASLEGIVTTWNPAAEAIYGYAAEEIIGQHISLLSPESKAGEDDAMLAELAAGARCSQRDTLRRTKSGKEIEVSVLLSPICDSSGQMIALSSIHRDVTEMNATRRALHDKEMQIRQKQKLEAVGSLAGGVAHEFNNLLQAILGYTRFAMEDMEPEDPRAEDLSLVIEAAERASALTRQLLHFGRRDEVRKSLVSPSDIVSGLVKLIRPLIGEHIDLDVVLDVPSSAIHADAGLVDQMLMNLCLNARDAVSPGGRLSIEARTVELHEPLVTRWSQIEPGRYVQFVVEDDGEGMTDEVVDRVFEPFFTTKPIGQGTGLGLPMVYGVVQQHGGSLNIITAPGHGTRFEINLPAVDHEEVAPEFFDAPPALVGSGVVLIAEDEPLVRDVASRVLRRAGFDVLSVDDGEQAIRLLHDYPGDIDLALLDMVMPKRTGREVYAALQATHPETKAIFCSGYAAEPDFGEFLVTHDLPLLQKPFAPEALLNVVESILRGEACLKC